MKQIHYRVAPVPVIRDALTDFQNNYDSIRHEFVEIFKYFLLHGPYKHHGEGFPTSYLQDLGMKNSQAKEKRRYLCEKSVLSTMANAQKRFTADKTEY